MKYFVTANDTDSGKSLASAILCEALQADYWKPVQAGSPGDTDVVRSLVSNDKTFFHPEAYCFKTPASPHAAAKAEHVSIQLQHIKAPATDNDLVIEGAGGCLVPLNDQQFIIDLIPFLGAEVILVSNLYLGSINHTLLTAEALHKRNLYIKGIIFNGEANPESERIILHHTNLTCLLRIKKEPFINKQTVQHYAAQLKANWHE